MAERACDSPLKSFHAFMNRIGIASGFASCLAIAVTMAILRPIAHGHSYNLAVEVTAVLVGSWLVLRYWPHWVEQKSFLWVVFLVGVFFAVKRPLTLNPDAEIVHVYRDVLNILKAGKNPYTCGSITHFDEYGRSKLGNFNYPPAEIWPYWLAEKLFGTWNWIVLAVTLASLHALACLVLWRTFPQVSFWTLGAFFPLLVFFELRTNVAETLLVVSLLLFVMQRQSRAPRTWHRPALWALFGVGLTAKFLVIPLFFAYLWHDIELRGKRKLLRTIADALAPLLIAGTIMAPFGIASVFQETVLFNLNLKQRAPLTTFYPNVLSGPFEWLGVPHAYSVVAVLALAGAVLATYGMRRLDALLCAVTAFLLVSPTPEPQYIPVVLYLTLAALLGRRHSEPREPAPS